MKKYLLITVSAVSMLLSACSGGSFEKLNTSFHNNFDKGNYEQASTDLVKATASKNDDGKDTLGKNTYLAGVQAGTASLWARQPKESIKDFDFADAIYLSKLENESGYDPKYYETIMIQTYKSLAALSENDASTGNVMINRANEMQNRAIKENQKEINELIKQLKETAAKVPDLKKLDFSKKIASAQEQLDKGSQFKAATDYMNPYTSYLYGLIKSVDGNSAGEGALKRVAEQAPKNTFVPTDYAAANGNGAVWVIFENGLVGSIKPKTTEVPLLGIWKMNVSIPAVNPSKAPVKNLTVKSGNKEVKTEFIGNMDNIVATELKQHELFNIIKSMIFELGKLAAASQACGGLNKECSGIQLKIAQKALEAEYPWDLRSWTSLPKEVQVARVEMPTDRKINVSEIGDITLPKDSKFALVVVRKPTADAKVSYVVTKLK